MPAPSFASELPPAARRSVVPFGLLVGYFALGRLIEANPDQATLFGVHGPACPSTWFVGSAGCPGCGLTRATGLLFDGQWSAAHQVHPAVSCVALLAALALALHALVLYRRERPEWVDGALRTGRALLALALVVGWAVRLA
ncbi:MAG: DUF2752 domain-containing protein [Planctomycetota bacterium]